MNTFLPPSYEIPASPSNYTKFKPGLNRIRVLSSAIVGYEYFTTENKPVRSPEPFEDMPTNIKEGGKIKPFWAFVVWNYDQHTVQILEVTQISIMRAMKSLVENSKWGDPKQYDIAITKTGENLDTEYNVQAEPPIGNTDINILDAYRMKPVNLEALYDGANPFEAVQQ